MKKILLMCCFLIGITAVSHAQGGRMRMSPTDRAKMVQTNLKLTDDQTAKLTAIYTMQAAKQDSIRSAANGDRQAMMQAMGPVRQMVDAQIATVLTADQMAAYTKMQSDMRARMQQGGGGTPPPPSN